jgi:hypothetical protein
MNLEENAFICSRLRVLYRGIYEHELSLVREGHPVQSLAEAVVGRDISVGASLLLIHLSNLVSELLGDLEERRFEFFANKFLCDSSLANRSSWRLSACKLLKKFRARIQLATESRVLVSGVFSFLVSGTCRNGKKRKGYSPIQISPDLMAKFEEIFELSNLRKCEV